MSVVAERPAAASEIAVENPATGEVVGTVPVMSAEEVAEAAKRARAAQPAWAAIGVKARGEVFKRAQQWLFQNEDRMIDCIRSETGKTTEDANLEFAIAVQAFSFWAKNAPKYLADEKVRASSPLILGRSIRVRYAPVGLVGVIGPWNYPLVNAFGDCVPALMAGNSVILKPSEVTPMTALLAADMMKAAGLPDNVFQVVTGAGETGSALVDQVDFVMFTGSTRTGKKVMQRAAETLTPVSLELGGKDPMIVLKDADLERAANGAVFYSMNNGGQVCISVERVYVEEPVYDEFVSKVVGKVGQLRQGSGAVGTTEVGAVTFTPQVDIIKGHVDDALSKGAKALTGGETGEGPGQFFKPTVLVDVDHSMSCMTEETFGPTLPIMKVKDADEAVKMANDSIYGLQSSIWTKDIAKGQELAERVEAGACCINDAMLNYGAFGAPMGGWKESGVGSRHGAGGIRKYCKTQTIMANRFAMKRDLFMFPYSSKQAERLGKMLKMLYGRGA
jgi:acyl-CoA reductase-like NAD-dependent aldehyde dehydrogenase